MTKSELRNQSGPNAAAHADLEARIVVLEIVSMTALALALDTSDNADADHARSVAGLILDTVRQRCGELGMEEPVRQSAQSYADELLSTALVSLYPTDQ